MFSTFSKLLRGLAGTFRAPKRQKHSVKATIRPRLETLESRLAPSAAGLAGPYYLPVRDAYVTAGTAVAGDPLAPGYRWAQSSLGAPVTLTYSYSNLLDGHLGGSLSASQIRAAIQEALSRWAAVVPIEFVEAPDQGPPPSAQNYSAAGLPEIRFGHVHIDGPYNVLAYGYYPGGAGLSGDVQFDDSENWATNPHSGVDLLEVATHEIGHALGLAHEPAPASGGVLAVMNPVYAGHFNGLGASFLYPDDVAGIQALYGAGHGSVTPAGSAPTTPPVPPGLEATLTGPATVYLNSPAVVTFANTKAGQHFAYDFNNDGAWDVGNGSYGGSPGVSSASLPASLLSSARTLVVRGRVINADGTFRDTFVNVQVTSRPPVVTLPPGGTIGQTVHLAAAGTIADPDSQGWTATVDYGDGSGVRAVAVNGNSFVLDHGYASPGTFTVTVTVTDQYGSSGFGQLTVTVAPQAPQVLFVDDLFREVLHRAPSAGEEANFAGALQQGAPASAVVNGVWNSDEARAGRLAEYYRTIMGREIDAGGQANWLENMRRGMIDEDVLEALVASPEFVNATPQNADFVRIVFRYVLGRETDASGLQSWTAHLDQGMTRADLVLDVLHSAERQTNLLDRYFSDYLGRGVTAADLASWRPGSNPNLTVSNLATAILSSAEFQARRWWL